MRMRQVNAMRFTAIALLVIAGGSCSGCGGGDSGEVTPQQRYDNCLAINDPARQASCLIELSVDQEKLRDKPGADQSRKSAAEAADQIADPFSRVEAFFELAEAYIAADKGQQAKVTYDGVNEGMEEVEAPADKARLFVMRAKLKKAADSRDGAELARNDLDDATKLLDEIKLAVEKIEIAGLLIAAYEEIEIADASQEVAARLAEIPDSVEEWSGKVEALVAIAGVQRLALKDSAAGVASLDKARKIVEGIDLSTDKSQRLKKASRMYDLALGYIDAGQSDPARDLLDTADDLAKKDPDSADLPDKINTLRARL